MKPQNWWAQVERARITALHSFLPLPPKTNCILHFLKHIRAYFKFCNSHAMPVDFWLDVEIQANHTISSNDLFLRWYAEIPHLSA